ncbi:MAG TPA: tRNA threonylcarbamoyladenosine dehydratase, partial [Mizugakiibacter sp.]|nr:tRNA threonylcarbamoyladenosine dehydratase [Mizugakiibacter sp.]
GHLDPRFLGIDRLYGTGSVTGLADRRVTVIGVGGVGSWAAEALVRSGIGGLRIIDGDDVCIANTNRQSQALQGQYGRAKVEALAERLLAIHPQLRMEPVPRFLTADTLEPLLSGSDLVLDACDALRVKVETIVWCRRRKLPLVVVGSAGGRADPTRIQVRDLSRTEHDAMLSLVRRKLRKEFAFPRNRNRYFGVPAVYSLENVRYPQADGRVSGMRSRSVEGSGIDCGGGLGAALHVTGSFAFAAVGKALSMLLRER